MEQLLYILAANSLGAIVLAALAAAVGRWCRAPALTHVLWLLVLVKLVTPPLVEVPMFPSQREVPERIAPTPVEIAQSPQQPIEAVLASNWIEPGDVAAIEARDDAPLEMTAGQPAPARQYEWSTLLAAAWATGTVLYIVMAVVRARGFSRLIAEGNAATAEDRATVDRLAAQLRMHRTPRLVCVPARIPPAVWPAWRGAIVLLPAKLFARLAPGARRALLAHELAHIHRRDHWVRIFELAVTALIWWHPLVWIARGRVREAEEWCCDRHVLRLCRGEARQYATALVDTLDFLAGRPAVLPAMASGAGPVGPLKRRIEMLMTNAMTKAVAWPVRFTVLAAAVAMLSLAPAWAEDEKARDETESAAEVVAEFANPQGISATAEVDAGGEVIDVLTELDEAADEPGNEPGFENGFGTRRGFSFRNRAANGEGAESAEAANGEERQLITIMFPDGSSRKIVLPSSEGASEVTISVKLKDGAVTGMGVMNGGFGSTGRARSRQAVSSLETAVEPANRRTSTVQSVPGVRATRSAATSRVTENVRGPLVEFTLPDTESTEARLDRIERVLEQLQKKLDARPAR